MIAVDLKPLAWIGSSREDVRSFPEEVKDAFGFALFIAQRGGRHRDTKPLKGFGGAGVMEIMSSQGGDAYRAVFTVRFAERVYVLHAFQKKSKRGIATPRREIEIVKARLRLAGQEHARWLAASKEP